MIILTDSNAKHIVWGNRSNSHRGEKMYEFILKNDLNIINNPNLGPTFTKAAIEQNTNVVNIRKSYIDLTVINNKLDSDKIKWYLNENLLNTEHKLIYST